MRWDLVRLGMEARRREKKMSRMKRYEESLRHDEALGTDCPCPVCVEMADVHNAAMSDEEELVSREEAREWLARCRASLHGGDKSDKLGSSGEKEER